MSENSLILQTLLKLEAQGGRVEQKVDSLTAELAKSNERIQELQTESVECKLSREGSKRQVLGMTTVISAFFGVAGWFIKDFFTK